MFYPTLILLVMMKLNSLFMRYFIFFCGFVFSGSLFAVNAVELLQDMSKAVHSKNYQGTFVYQQGNKLETMQVTHLKENQHEQELLSSLTGQVREVFRNDQAVICVIPGAASIDKRMSQKGFARRFSHLSQNLQNLYQFKKTAINRIAGRDCQTIKITPKDQLRYGYTVCIDLKDRLPLRVDMQDHQGKRLSSMMFTALKTGKGIHMPIPQQIRNKTKLSVARHQPAKSLPYQASPWQLTQSPKGFQIQLYEQRKNEQLQLLHHFVLSDGLVSISVYIEKADQDILKGSSHMGAMNIFARLHHQHQIIAVGEVPIQTLKQISGRFVYQNK